MHISKGNLERGVISFIQVPYDKVEYIRRIYDQAPYEWFRTGFLRRWLGWPEWYRIELVRARRWGRIVPGMLMGKVIYYTTEQRAFIALKQKFGAEANGD